LIYFGDVFSIEAEGHELDCCGPMLEDNA
jgi:hypothetical protein